MKAYKGFNQNMTCRDFQYEDGKTYETDKAVLCEAGFHACENPVMCFGHYSPNTSVFHEVELEDVSSEQQDDTKRVGKKITIGAELGIPQICQLTFEYVKAHCTNEHNAKAGEPATAGDYGAATAGNRGAATSRGSSASGRDGLSVVRGNNVRVKGGIGAVLVIAEEDTNSYDIKDWKAVVVDGETVKADTWYKLVNGELVEVTEQ